MKNIVHFISHTHWDPAWFAQRKYTRRWLVPFINKVLETLKAQPTYKFVLDGQTSILEDYFDQLSEKERIEKKAELVSRVKEGRLLVGPFYIGADWTLVSASALFHNLLYGCQDAKRLGGVMKVGWLLDQFGFPAYSWQILKGFGIESAFIWRGLCMEPSKLSSEVSLVSPDGSELLGIYLWDSYRNAMALAPTKSIAKDRVYSEVKKVSRYCSTEHVLLMNGYEFDPRPDDILPLLHGLNQEKKIKAVQSTPLEYERAIREANPTLPKIKGYLYSGRYSPLLSGVRSSRIYLKQANDGCQSALERWAEPFSAFAKFIGAPYPREELNKAWRMLLRNQAHDEICGCGIDDIHRDNMEDYREIRRIADKLKEKALRSIAGRIEANPKALVVFNPLPWKRDWIATGVIKKPKGTFLVRDPEGNPIPCQISSTEAEGEVELSIWCKDLPGYGYQTYYLTKEKSKVEERVKAGKNWMENRWIRVEINEDGSLNLVDKLSQVCYKRIGYFEDGGEIGDTYDYSYPKNDRVINTLDRKASITLLESGPIYALFKIEHRVKLPSGLAPDRLRRSESEVLYPILTLVRLSANAPTLDFKTIINNVAKDHRLRVVFPTDIETRYSHSDQQLDVAKFKIKPEAYPEEVPEGMVIAGKDLVQVASKPQKNWVDLTNGSRGFALLSSGLPEYEVYPLRNSIALTLLRCVGWLARTDLLTREGDVGWEFFTPEAQCLGKYEFNYSILPHRGDWAKGRVYYWAEARSSLLQIIQVEEQKGELPPSKSFLSISPEILNVASIKLAENNDDLIVTLINRSEDEVSGEVKFGFPIRKVYQVNLVEEIQKELDFRRNKIKLKLKGKGLLSLRFEVEPKEMYTSRRPTRVLVTCLSTPLRGMLRVRKPELITEKALERELLRVKDIELELTKAKKEFEQTEFKNILEKELARYKMTKATRLLAEKEYSYLLTRKRYAELKREKAKIEELNKEIESLASQLANLRIEGRCQEFLIDYYKRHAGN